MNRILIFLFFTSFILSFSFINLFHHTPMSTQPEFQLNPNHSFNNNIFTFEQDEDHQQNTNHQTQNHQYHTRTHQETYQTNPKVKTHKRNLETVNSHPQDNQIFTFDQDEDQQNISDNEDQSNNPPFDNNNHRNRRPYQNEQDLDDLKSRILHKQSNNFIDKNTSSLSSSSFQLPAYSPKPEAITRRFEEKVNKLKQTMKENNIKEPFSKTSIKKMPLEKSSIKSKLAHNYLRKASNNLSRHNIDDQSPFEAFKEGNFEDKHRKSYEVQGATIVTGQQQTNQFQYVQEQKAIKVTNLREFLFTQLAEEYKVNALITRIQDGGFLGKLVSKTKFIITIEENHKFLFSVTKDGLNKFVFSMNKEDCSQKNKNYLGQLLSKDFSNTDFILYDNGFDPKETKCLQYCFKQLASVQYQESSGPRKFSVVISTNNKGFHTMESGQNILQKKWSQKKERKNLAKLYSKEPEFDENDGNYKLDFKGMAGKPSVKNFVLSSDDYEDCLIFARRTNDTYALEVKHPFSLIQAVAVCISSIYHKTIL